MFKRSISSRDRVGKSVKPAKKTYRDETKIKMQEKLDSPSSSGSLTSPIVTLIVGQDQRVFAAHEDVLSLSPFFAAALKHQMVGDSPKQIGLHDEEPEILSCVLEYLYKGDYYPRLLQSKRHNPYYLEDSQLRKTGGRGSSESVIFHSGIGNYVLRDTVIYCAAEKYGLDGLKSLALKKQGLHVAIPADVILRSARYTYDNTPDSESRLRAHFLALIIRSRKTFKRSGTMQTEMEMGGKLFFDLFVAMCNHIDDVAGMKLFILHAAPMATEAGCPRNIRWMKDGQVIRENQESQSDQATERPPSETEDPMPPFFDEKSEEHAKKCEKFCCGDIHRVAIQNIERENLEDAGEIPEDQEARLQARHAGEADSAIQRPGVHVRSSVMVMSLESMSDSMSQTAAVLFSTLDEQDRGAVSSFLLTGEYFPMLIESRVGQNPLQPGLRKERCTAYYLEGYRTREEYNAEALRCAWMYNLAHSLYIPNLEMLAVRKLKLGCQYVEEDVIIQVASFIFSSIDGHREQEYEGLQTTATKSPAKPCCCAGERDPMRAYIAEYFGTRLASLSIQNDAKFWTIMMRYTAFRAAVYLEAGKVISKRLAAVTAAEAELN
ncbi:hypothetical protein LOZ12_004534 [Ophidiomyces ophidiicola]|uniref:Uncharacterized protein n=1 Tax=Ophidiomyces ophidiicola TaxID=1387563 RepID=A0ACB8V325_9EURO|nr:hypothetical protein LOZ64_004796 [Ophidiomyces ophidiicola]KAI1954728.1 hypothetical protein LOZ62_000743 [Ophidiomyces ophidiicola]KAI1973448.1 hypothetical protein LOZ56_001886 [Ophidiomyces ophidiicola]KAI2007628.1 hypothetical protein LOZ50_002504 [Ophidiomyces ophidiicola]KAI2019584.1 hypothetical protein LOZ46_003225 [Ophidiomyces ophidiicola]